VSRFAVLVLSSFVGLLAPGLASAGPPPPPAVAAGEVIYERCAACHSLDQDRTGPHHCGLFGRRAGSVAGFAYSEAMKNSGIIWNRKTLDRFIADPIGTVPGTFMGYAGVQDATERAELIDFLEFASRSEPCKRFSTGSAP
jgi:cytochrome c